MSHDHTILRKMKMMPLKQSPASDALDAAQCHCPEESHRRLRLSLLIIATALSLFSIGGAAVLWGMHHYAAVKQSR